MVLRDASNRGALESWREEQITCLSHDLKNPLTVIKLQTDRLERRLGSDGGRDELAAVRAISANVTALRHLVDEILEIAYLESPEMELCAEPVELPAFIDAVLTRSLCNSARLNVEVRAHAVAMIEPRRIERVLVNLIDNAVHHSPPESPILVRIDAREHMAVVSVVDRGPGLTREEAAYVFDKFRRTPDARKRPGAGLGLYISRKIVEAHRGRIGVDGGPGVGATFHFTVPLDQGQGVAPREVAVGD